jgi:hypothetical protein
MGGGMLLEKANWTEIAEKGLITMTFPKAGKN